jgi:hypothetical protein
MSKGSVSKKEKSDALKRHKENEKEEEEGFNKKWGEFLQLAACM